ncbi:MULTISPECIES: AI-2E family transporter [unclassified Duganella]|uniref:AI-2E family transporter n=1 Tax=unclassified Duganella TaxID=2636909 RepID=UPI000884D512|nr:MULTISPECIES: AI-2E family transporter [unclassified Duganella]SDG38410.1 Predicted PurR-regulated permease PerM [Duganella sp. OV458]SDJ65313.1 Predicted PurR-regulated permease PerM [Duganella sp. OV510]
MSDSLTSRTLPGAVAGLVGTATVLALLYFGRDVLIPITLAFIFSFLIAPFVRALRHLGLGQTLSVCTGVLVVTVSLLAIGAVIVQQVGAMGASLPLYQDTIADKVEKLDELTRGTIGSLGGPAGQLIEHFTQDNASGAQPVLQSDGSVKTPVLVEIHEPALKPFQLLGKIAASVWPPLETAGIVFVVLIFVLLEHESLRDRFIRLAGGGDLRATTIAVNDAGERLSRFFISQFLVNIATGLAVWLGLSLIGLGQALLWGTMTAVLRFIPYVGVWMAAFCATLLAAAIDPGWSMALMTLGLFLAIEIIVAQTIEPKLYGHTTGLSPLSVVVSAIFWSWIWGPVGLVLSTPLTLCLVVAGRYIRALKVLEIMFGELPALTMPQNFYQRALSGDAHEIITSAKRYMQHKSLAEYCDGVLLPALHLANFDLKDRAITPEEEEKVTSSIISVIEALSGNQRWWKKRKRSSVLTGGGIGRQLRAQRISDSGEWQGSFDVPPGSVVLSIGLGTQGAELATEILVRILREQKIDARSRTVEELDEPPPPGATPELVAIVILVSVDPLNDCEQITAMLEGVRERVPHAKQFALLLPSPFENPDLKTCVFPTADHVSRSYDDVLHSCQVAMKGQGTV